MQTDNRASVIMPEAGAASGTRRSAANVRTALALTVVALVCFGSIIVAQRSEASGMIWLVAIAFAFIAFPLAMIARERRTTRVSDRRESDRANQALLLKLALIAASMFAFGYLLVPFYEAICKATGLRDIDAPDKIGNMRIDTNRTVRIELDANVNKLPWHFRADTPIVNVHPGALMTLFYEVENTADRPMTGQAVPSYGPPLAAAYFKKLECFCFTKQSFAPHEKRQMPVVFVVDPKLPQDVTTITLSYTFFEIEASASGTASGAQARNAKQ